MSPTSETWVHEALGRALDDLLIARAEYEVAVIKLHKVEEAVRSLRALAGEDDDDAFEVDPEVAAERNRIVHGEPAARPPRRKQSLNNSTMRVVRVLVDAKERRLDADEIVAEFRRRDWPESDGAIQQAARRCQGYGFVWRDAERRYAATKLGRAHLDKAIQDERDEMEALRREAMADTGDDMA